ncbi:MAG: hypothetical protein AAFZ09_08510 [Pseudomonadota bacterium]
MARSLRALLLAGLLAGLPAAGGEVARADAVGGAAHPPTAEALAQVAAVRAAVERYRDFDAAIADGWYPFGGEEALVGQHFHHDDTPDYVAGDALDFAQPTHLMYATVAGERVLTGVTFGVRLGPGEAVPEGFAGAADDWHVHDLDRVVEVGMADRPIIRLITQLWLDWWHPSGRDGRRRRAMLHVWVNVENPDGPFALQNPALAYLQHGLDPALAVGRDDAVARGLALALEGGCRRVYGPRLEVAMARGRQMRAILGDCEVEAGRIREALATGGIDGAAPVAARAARRMAELYWLTLDADQHDRVGAMADHGDAFCTPETS